MPCVEKSNNDIVQKSVTSQALLNAPVQLVFDLWISYPSVWEDDVLMSSLPPSKWLCAHFQAGLGAPHHKRLGAGFV